jgi:glutamate synthase (NADPH/NADH) small chain
MDSARSALRLGADEVHLVYRRAEEQAPARREELENAKAEGVIFHWLTNPVEILGTDKMWVRGMRVQAQELGEPDSSGRPRPVPIPGSEYDMDVDMVVMAIGTRPNPMIFTDQPDLERTRRGTVVAIEETGRTRKPRVWAGGDIVTGAATVISAMGAGKRAAEDMDAFLKDSDQEWWVGPEEE